MTGRKDTPLDEYYAALQRLQSGKPHNVPQGTAITKDAVSLEAGRGKGSIKRSRAIFGELIRSIEEAARSERDYKKNPEERLARSRKSANDYRLKYEAALGRELSLLKELYELKKHLAKLTGDKVIPLRQRDIDRTD